MASHAGPARKPRALWLTRNGILLAPLTAIAVAEIVLDKVPSFDLGPFSIGRFPPDTTT